MEWIVYPGSLLTHLQKFQGSQPEVKSLLVGECTRSSIRRKHNNHFSICSYDLADEKIKIECLHLFFCFHSINNKGFESNSHRIPMLDECE